MAFNNEEILVLAKAGFTAQQIAALNVVGSQPAPEPAPATQPAPAPQPAPATAAPHSVDDVLTAISGLSASIQNANLLQAQMPTEQKTTETILASIINPIKKEE